MSRQQRASGTLGEVLATRRRRHFVGRRAELELFRSALDVGEPPFCVLYLHGPGGIGKTSLLEVLSGLAEERDATVVRLDGRELVPSPGTILDALRPAIELPGGDGSVDAGPDPLVLLVDSYERLAPLDDWVRSGLLPRLPASTLTVLASRAPPSAAWRADPAWRELLRVVSLRNLGPAESREYLTGCGVDPVVHDRLLEVTYGHPLGLSLMADIVTRGGDVSGDALAPDLVGNLLHRFVDVVPDDQQRAALAVCAVARVTTEALLRDALDTGDAHELFRWLSGRSFVESGPEGLFPHELARDALDADLRWRDPEEYTRIFRRVTAHIHDHLRTLSGRAQLRAISDLKFVFHHVPSVLSPVDWDSWGQHYPEPARAEDRAAVLALIAEAEGEESAGIAARWWDRQPLGFSVVRGEDDAVRGVIGLVDLTAASEQDRTADPGAQAVWDHAHRHAPPRPGERITQMRFLVDRETYQGPSPTLNAVPLVTLQHHLATSNLAWAYQTLYEPDPWNEYFALADLHRAVEADFVVEGRRYGVFAHDFRQVPVDDLVRLWIERALAQDPTLRPEPAPSVLVLSQAEFSAAARQGLRDLHRPDLLERNPLLRTRMLRDHADGETPAAQALEGLLRTAIDTLRQHPRDDKLLRAVERTYLDPAPTQEAAAARLGLPFSTYRRHLTQGLSRVVSWLWDRELYDGADAERR
jgi:energy-coupling factor transporter ATP-binding protein EcfA2